jgi:2-polyprenyl-6-methoxyphenol hydroxylase-like FAD-dependent oxidoreductase
VTELENVEVLLDWAAEDVSQDETGATVTIVERNGDGRKTLRAQYVIGCDGSNSVVRDAQNLEQDIDPHDKHMVLLVFQSPQLHDLLE